MGDMAAVADILDDFMEVATDEEGVSEDEEAILGDGDTVQVLKAIHLQI